MKKIIFLAIFIFILTCICSQKGNTLLYEKILELPTNELLSRGDRYLSENNTDTALVYYVATAAKFNNSNLTYSEKVDIIQSYIKAGDIYYDQVNYLKAMDFYLKGSQICEMINAQEFLPIFYKSIGNIHSKFEDFERSLEFYKKGLELTREQHDIEMEAKFLFNLIGLHCYMNDPQEAKKYYNQIIRLKLKDNILQEYLNLLELGYIYKTEEKNDSAIIYFKKALDVAMEKNLEPRYIASATSELAFQYENIGKIDMALEKYLFNQKIMEDNSLIDMMPLNQLSLSVVYDIKGNKEKALFHKNRYLTLSDSIFNMKEFNRIKNAQLMYEMDKIDQHISKLNADKEKSELQLQMQQKILWIISSGLCVFLILLVIVTRQKKKLENAYIDLFDRNNEIIKSNQANRKMRIEFEKKLQEEKKYTQFLKEKLKLIDEETSENEDEEDTGKLNKLTEEQKEKLIAEINNVMENTLEFCDCDFSLNRLATLIGSNTKYVSQIINEAYNKNFRTYINEYRIKEACLRLMNTAEYGNYTIKAIAESVGYKSHTNFILIFKKITGINPSTYQRIAKKQLKEA